MGRGKKQLRRARLWLDVSIVGIQFPVAIGLGYLFGRWLDGLLNTKPWLTMTFALFGIAAGFVNLFRITAQAAMFIYQLLLKIDDVGVFQPDRHGLLTQFVQCVAIALARSLKCLHLFLKFRVEWCQVDSPLVGNAVELVTLIDV